MKRCIALLLIFAMMSTFFVGCAPVEPVERDITELNPENPLELIVILGNHANAWLSLEDLKKEDGEFAKLFARTLEFTDKGDKYMGKCHLKVIVCDGSPTEGTLLMQNGKPLELYEISPNFAYMEKSFANEMFDDIVRALNRDNLIADDDEVDLLAALMEASGKFETDRERMIYIMDTGLCTTGEMSMTTDDPEGFDLLTLSADEMLLGINTGSFPDLAGIHVKFRNLADFCGEQELIDDTTVRNAFKDLWIAALKKCGVENPDVSWNGSEYDKQVDPYDAARYPRKVSKVKFKTTNDEIEVRGASEPFDPVEDADLLLNDATVGGYDMNKHEPNDVEKAKKIAAEKKQFMDRILEAHPDCVFYVIGSSSYRKNKFYTTDPDAKARAEIVTQYLIEAGVSADRIIPIDAGSNTLPWRNADEKENPEANHVVAIIPSYRVEIIRVLNDIFKDNRLSLDSQD